MVGIAQVRLSVGAAVVFLTGDGVKAEIIAKSTGIDYNQLLAEWIIV